MSLALFHSLPAPFMSMIESAHYYGVPHNYVNLKCKFWLTKQFKSLLTHVMRETSGEDEIPCW